MVTLAKRATPAQARILRIVEGAVINAADAHGLRRDPWLARSIAKRAAGTLSAQWPEVLATSTKSSAKGAVSNTQCRACEQRRATARTRIRRERRASQTLRRPPLAELWQRLKCQMWHLDRQDDRAPYEATKGLLRMIDKMQREMAARELESA